jgi:hypothetical protein
MTDILTRLAALTLKNDAGLLPCPFCQEKGQPLIWRKGNENTKDRGCDVGCAECGFTKSIRVIRYSMEWAEERAVAAWNARPREAALIALVQEAAAEIERLRTALSQATDFAAHVLQARTVEVSPLLGPWIEKWKLAINPQEAANGQD